MPKESLFFKKGERKIEKAISLFLFILIGIFMLGAGAPQTAQAAAKKLKFAVVGYAMGSTFHTTLWRGAQDACKDLGIDCTINAPQVFDLQKQVGMMEAAVDSGANAVIFSAIVENGYNDFVKMAHQKGVIVEAFNADGPESRRDAFAGPSISEAGYLVAKELFKAMGGTGKYAILTCGPGAGWSNQRVQGIKQAQAEYKNVKLLGEFDSSVDLTKVASTSENLMLANPDLKAIIHVDYFCEGTAAYLKSSGKAGKILLAGYDLTPGNVQAVKDGAIQFLGGQRPYTAGYMAVVNLYLKLVKGKGLIDPLNTKLDLVTKENVDQFTGSIEQ